MPGESQLPAFEREAKSTAQPAFALQSPKSVDGRAGFRASAGNELSAGRHIYFSLNGTPHDKNDLFRFACALQKGEGKVFHVKTLSRRTK
jgi:hypothetical protein